jgi:hypothetical protein
MGLNHHPLHLTVLDLTQEGAVVGKGRGLRLHGSSSSLSVALARIQNPEGSADRRSG